MWGIGAVPTKSTYVGGTINTEKNESTSILSISGDYLEGGEIKDFEIKQAGNFLRIFKLNVYSPPTPPRLFIQRLDKTGSYSAQILYRGTLLIKIIN